MAVILLNVPSLLFVHLALLQKTLTLELHFVIYLVILRSLCAHAQAQCMETVISKWSIWDEEVSQMRNWNIFTIAFPIFYPEFPKRVVFNWQGNKRENNELIVTGHVDDNLPSLS